MLACFDSCVWHYMCLSWSTWMKPLEVLNSLALCSEAKAPSVFETNLHRKHAFEIVTKEASK